MLSGQFFLLKTSTGSTWNINELSLIESTTLTFIFLFLSQAERKVSNNWAHVLSKFKYGCSLVLYAFPHIFLFLVKSN